MLKKSLIGIGVLFFLIVSLVHADTQNLSVTGSVAPYTTDFPLTVVSDANGTLPQGNTITYTITYGSQLLYADAITIEAYWDEGTIAGASIPSIDGIDYVSGSASTAYGGTSPVVNLTSQKISWAISSFPANTTNKTVSFQLKTNGSYTGTSSVDFPVRVRLIATNYTKPYQTTDVTYQYDSTLVTPTPTPTPSTTTTSSGSTTSTGSTPTPTPTTVSTTNQSSLSTTAPLQSLTKPFSNAPIQNLTLVNVTDSSTQIAVNLNKVKKASVLYGLSPTTLSQTVPLAISGTDGTIDLQDLAADSTYYMQMVTTDTKGQVTKSEVFAVQTAQTSATPQVATASLVVASDNNVLYSAGLNQVNGTVQTKSLPQIPVSQNGNYTFAFKLTKTNKIKMVSMTVENTSVLGVSTFHPIAQPLEYSFPVIQQDNGTYNVQIKNPTIPGTYDVYVKITDYDGNISTQKIATIRVLKPFRVYNALTKNPIEDVRILLYKLNPETNSYELLPNFGGTSNPIYTNNHGEVSESLAKGKYKANFGRIGYFEKDNVTFAVGTTPQDDFPTVYLSPAAITPLAIFSYYSNAFTDYIGTTSEYIAAIQQSYRYFDLIGLGVIFCFVVMTFLLFSIKTHIRFTHLSRYFTHHMSQLLSKGSLAFIHGTVTDNMSHLPISQATVYLINEATGDVLTQTTSNKAGGFILPGDKKNTYLISVMKEGYEVLPTTTYKENMTIQLNQHTPSSLRIRQALIKALEDGASLFFEFMLVLSLLLELALFPAFGILRTLPFLAASVLNMVLWIFYLHEEHHIHP